MSRVACKSLDNKTNKKQTTSRKKEKFILNDFDEKLSSLARRKNNREKQPSLNNANCIDVDKNDNNRANVEARPLRKASRAALINIGKALSYEDKIEVPSKHDDDSTLTFPIPEIPEIPLTLNSNDAFDMIDHANIDPQTINTTNESIPFMPSKKSIILTV